MATSSLKNSVDAASGQHACFQIHFMATKIDDETLVVTVQRKREIRRRPRSLVRIRRAIIEGSVPHCG